MNLIIRWKSFLVLVLFFLVLIFCCGPIACDFQHSRYKVQQLGGDSRAESQLFLQGEVIATAFTHTNEKWFKLVADEESTVYFFIMNPHVLYRVYVDNDTTPMFDSQEPEEPLFFALVPKKTYYFQLLFQNQTHQSYQYETSFFLDSLIIEEEEMADTEPQGLEKYTVEITSDTIVNSRIRRIKQGYDDSYFLIHPDGGFVKWTNSGFGLYNTKHGLSSDQIVDVAELGSGKVWYLTTDKILGLTDGIDSWWIPSDVMKCKSLYGLWVDDDVSWLLGKDEVCVQVGLRWHQFFQKDLFKSNPILMIADIPDEGILLSTSKGVIHYYDTLSMMDDINKICIPTHLLAISSDLIYFACTNDIYEYHQGTINKIDHEEITQLYAIKGDPQNRLIVLAKNWSGVRTDDTWVNYFSSTSDDVIHDVIHDVAHIAGDTYLVSDNAVYYWDESDNTWSEKLTFRYRLKEPFILAQNNELLVGSKGLEPSYLYHYQANTWKKVYPNGLVDNHVTALIKVPYSDNILVGTKSGMALLSRNGEEVTFSPILLQGEMLFSVQQLFELDEKIYGVVSIADEIHLVEYDETGQLILSAEDMDQILQAWRDLDTVKETNEILGDLGSGPLGFQAAIKLEDQVYLVGMSNESSLVLLDHKYLKLIQNVSFGKKTTVTAFSISADGLVYIGTHDGLFTLRLSDINLN